MEVFTLNCWVRGPDAGRTFEVEISKTETVAALKKAIRNENPATFRDVDAVTLDLYKPKDPVPRSYKENLCNLILSEHGELLEMGDDQISEVFPELLPKRHIHVIVDVPNLMIVCWLRGSSHDASFEISIPVNATMSGLKHHIRKAQLNLTNVSDHQICLYWISGDKDEVMQESLNKRGNGNLFNGHTLLPNFLGVPVLDPFHVIAKFIESPPSKQESFATHSKRRHPKDPVKANKHIRHAFAMQLMLTPLMIAMPSHFGEHYKKNCDPHIRCGRLGENQSPFPLVLAHPIFAAFVSECETYELSDEDLGFILKLSQCMCQCGDDKIQRTQFLACMREYGIHLKESKIEGTAYMTDGDGHVSPFPYFISEGKKDFSASHADPYIQSTAYHLAAIQSWLRTHPPDVCALPCIHIF